ncbi:hypothetical protein [Leptospira sarikeiensis]|uniref:Serine protease n=1 Tax=Leptospira sarikeiensis TaxID=2484943 RepID=A0A4R9K0T4_9LEPT|nr:hypothetical protein [Leptospira sarikeiensis]TGL58706.1 hypothetical protein EHQ64_16780 [Leptospira sarikeiensis]
MNKFDFSSLRTIQIERSIKRDGPINGIGSGFLGKLDNQVYAIFAAHINRKGEYLSIRTAIRNPLNPSQALRYTINPTYYKIYKLKSFAKLLLIKRKLFRQKIEFNTLFKVKRIIDVATHVLPYGFKVMHEHALIESKDIYKSYVNVERLPQIPKFKEPAFFSALCDLRMKSIRIEGQIRLIDNIIFLFKSKRHYVYIILNKEKGLDLKGSSGSPVFNSSNEVVGIVTKPSIFSKRILYITPIDLIIKNINK